MVPNAINKRQAEIVIGDIAIPPQPRLLFEIDKVYPEIGQVAALIARDPAVGAGVLKTVNSPAMGLPKKIVDIGQAVMLLGLDSVMNIVNAVMLHNAFSERLDDRLLKDFWQSTNDTAVAAGILAKRLSLARSDEAFTLGLFHNCAVPLILTKYNHYLDTMARAYADPRGRIADIERGEVGVDHAAISALVARAWHLPGSIIAAIRDHHRPNRHRFCGRNDTEQHVDALVAILKMAEHATGEHRLLGHQSVDHEWNGIKNELLPFLGLSEDDTFDLCEELMEEVQAADVI